jgi:hypothetical protein
MAKVVEAVKALEVETVKVEAKEQPQEGKAQAPIGLVCL